MRKCKFCGSRDIHMMPCHLYNPDVDVPLPVTYQYDEGCLISMVLFFFFLGFFIGILFIVL
jgi:hypothetical protein